jgi:Tfp pilus assembly protein PilN
MLLINLIAARRAERRKLELIRAVMVRAMLGIAAATTLGAVVMTFQVQTVKSRIDDVNQQTAALQDTVSRVELLQAQMGALQPRVATLLKAQNSTNRWRAVLEEISISLPEKTWITSFASQAGADGFTITGQSASQNEVGKAMMRLGTQAYIKDVNLQYTQSAAKSGSVTFALSGGLHPLEEKSDGK